MAKQATVTKKISKPTVEADGTVKLTPKPATTVSATPKAADDKGTVKAKITKVAVSKPESNALSVAIKKPEFLERVLARTDVKKRDVKPVVEATLAELARALLAGEELNLQPMGKVKVVKSKDVGTDAKALTVRLRTKTGPASQ